LGARAKCTVVVEAAGDVATASLLETFIDETERRVRFLSATVCDSY
jgi:DNA-binding ferritin-like protein